MPVDTLSNTTRCGIGSITSRNTTNRPRPQQTSAEHHRPADPPDDVVGGLLGLLHHPRGLLAGLLQQQLGRLCSTPHRLHHQQIASTCHAASTRCCWFLLLSYAPSQQHNPAHTVIAASQVAQMGGHALAACPANHGCQHAASITGIFQTWHWPTACCWLAWPQDIMCCATPSNKMWPVPGPPPRPAASHLRGLLPGSFHHHDALVLRIVHDA
jgi:hypothetical protein